MPSLNELKLSNKPLGDQTPDFDQLPAERGSVPPPPQPGSFRFTLPAKIDNFDTFPTPEHGERLTVIFDEASPLVIAQSPAKKYDGEAFQTRLNNAPRKRDKAGTLFISDMDYLLKALQEGAGEKPSKPKNASNLWYAQTVQRFAGKTFGADLEWSWRCNRKRAARFLADDGSIVTQEDAESQLEGDDAGLQAGCGEGHYQGDPDVIAQKAGGEWPLTIGCRTCGAQVRAFANLRNFKP